MDSEANVKSYWNSRFSSSSIPEPVKTFRETNFPDYIQNALLENQFTAPTAIQGQAWPIALKGHNMVGIAQTGSGKTLAYILPAIVHIKQKTQSSSTVGPIVLILAPTRELAQQIHKVCNLFGMPVDVWNACVTGGASKELQLQDIDGGSQICIATPGRLIDFIDEEEISLQDCTYLVLDEADRMLDMGFEPQIRQIIEHIRPDCQMLMFSATWPRAVQNLAEDYLGNFICTNVGAEQLSANHNITQLVEVVTETEKYNRLNKILEEIMDKKEKKTIVFVETKRRVNQLTYYLQKRGYSVTCIHGDKPQQERDRNLREFRNGVSPILVATDVASRGLDVNDIKFVINVDFPNCTEDYVHRIGRTARCNNTGTAITFFTSSNMNQAKNLVAVLKEANQTVDPKLKEFVERAASLRGHGKRKSSYDYRGRKQYGDNSRRNYHYKASDSSYPKRTASAYDKKDESGKKTSTSQSSGYSLQSYQKPGDAMQTSTSQPAAHPNLQQNPFPFKEGNRDESKYDKCI